MKFRPLYLLLLVALGGCSSHVKEATARVAVPPAAPSIRLSQQAFEVVGLPASNLQPGQAADAFAVYVVKESGSTEAVPPVLGSYHVVDSLIRFEPRFPLVPGLRYRAVFDPSRLPGQPAKSEPIVAEFVLPKPAPVATTVVELVYPTSKMLPENQLKFYLHFSAPMSRGEAYDHVRLLDASNKPVELPFLELGEELWDPEGKRFTLFFDPGRIKRGLKPREEVGPALVEGKTYTLEIDRNWSDARGNPLKEAYRKTFRVGPPDDQPVDLKTWKLQAPPAGSSKALTVVFPKPLDHALLHRLLWVTGPDDQRLPGTVTVTDEETRWRFTPQQSWKPGAYHLVADTVLEDLAGNSIGRAFEVDVMKPIQREVKGQTVQLPFQVSQEK